MPERTTVFLIGSPRSGTTYLQNLLGAHPAIATSQETDLFSRYVASWREVWQEQLPDDPARWQAARHKGLPAVLNESDVDDLLAGVIERVQSATLALKPGATVLLDKVPGNAFEGDLILRYVPDARFIHLIRDGRDVVCSLLRAGRGWGRTWAGTTVLENARLWTRHVEAGRALAERTDAYLEARYEQLDAVALQRLLAFCGVQATAAECERLLTEHALVPGRDAPSSILWGGEVAARVGSAPAEPEGFAGEGGIGAWRDQLDARGRIVVERYAGALLRELGYTDGSDWTGVGLGRRALAFVRLAGERLGHRARVRAREALT